MKRVRRALLAPAIVIAAYACGGPQEPGDSGDDCFRDNDCKPGLVCVPRQVASDRVCSNDVTGLVNQVPGPVAEPAAGGAGGASAEAGGAPGLGGASGEAGGAPGLGGANGDAGAATTGPGAAGGDAGGAPPIDPGSAGAGGA